MINNIIRELFSFPNPVNEVAARLVAGMVMLLCIGTVISGHPLLFVVLAYGFLARVATGPTLSPLGLIATRVIVPLLGNPTRLVPGPPKRFAQAIGLAFSGLALVLVLILESTVLAKTLVGVLVVFTFLESVLGFCAGCFVFNYLMRWGLIPESVCEQCVISTGDDD